MLVVRIRWIRAQLVAPCTLTVGEVVTSERGLLNICQCTCISMRTTRMVLDPLLINYGCHTGRVRGILGLVGSKCPPRCAGTGFSSSGPDLMLVRLIVCDMVVIGCVACDHHASLFVAGAAHCPTVR